MTEDSFYTDEYYYTGDGFIIDFSLGMTSDTFEKDIRALFEKDYIAQNTMVIFISFNCYEPSQDRFIVS